MKFRITYILADGTISDDLFVNAYSVFGAESLARTILGCRSKASPVVELSAELFANLMPDPEAI